MYNSYIFDLYGTLINLVIDEKSSQFWKTVALYFGYHGARYSSGEELEAEYLRIASEEMNRIDDTPYPDIDLLKVFIGLYEQKNIPITQALIERTALFFRAASTVSISLYPGVVDTLKVLKERGKKLYLLSNAQRIFSQAELKAMELDPYFDAAYYSGDIGRGKPDPDFLESLISGERITIKESVFIGNDHIADIGMARKAGMDTVYFHSNFSYPEGQEVTTNYRILDENMKELLALTRVQ